MEKVFKKELSALEEVFDFVETFAGQSELPEAAAFHLQFAIEEIFTNMVKYSVGHSTNELRIELQKQAGQIVIELTEFDVDAFDITQVEAANTALPLEDRRVGGLGLHLVRKVMDEVSYAHEEGNSKITLIKHRETRDV